MNFSIIIPLYNKSYSLKRCIDSVLAQEYREYELIVVDDGSSDDSISILRKLYFIEIEKGLIKVVEQQNEGVSSARNKGAKFSSSDYLCFLDADDEWKADFLSKMHDLIIDFPEAGLYCLAHEVSKKEMAVFKPKHGLPVGFRGYVEDFFASSSKGSVANSSKVCIKKKSLFDIDGFPLGATAGEDLYVWIRLALNGAVACDISYSVIVYVEIDESRMARRNSVPYPFVYFSSNKKISKSRSLNKYLFVIFYKHFSSSILSLNFREAWLRFFYYFKIYF
jgi:glycosyltransferase involved in cell wall biosynthesis